MPLDHPHESKTGLHNSFLTCCKIISQPCIKINIMKAQPFLFGRNSEICQGILATLIMLSRQAQTGENQCLHVCIMSLSSNESGQTIWISLLFFCKISQAYLKMSLLSGASFETHYRRTRSAPREAEGGGFFNERSIQ